MGQTPRYALRFPEPPDPADVPTDMHELADDVEAALTSKAPGAELNYADITAPVDIAGLTESGATGIVTASPITLPVPLPILIHFFTPAVRPPGGNGAYVILALWEQAMLAQLAVVQIASESQPQMPVSAYRRLTAAAGTHQYSVRAWASAAGATVSAGGGSVPAFIRITTAA